MIGAMGGQGCIGEDGSWWLCEGEIEVSLPDDVTWLRSREGSRLSRKVIAVRDRMEDERRMGK